MWGATEIVLVIAGIILLPTAVAAYTKLFLQSVRTPISKEEGRSDGDQARQYLKEDLERMRESLLVFTDSAEDWFWGPTPDDPVFRLLRSKIARGAKARFIVSRPEFQPERAVSVMSLAREFPDRVCLFQLPRRPEIDFWIVDERRAHISSHKAVDVLGRRPHWRGRGDLSEREKRDLYALVGELMLELGTVAVST